MAGDEKMMGYSGKPRRKSNLWTAVISIGLIVGSGILLLALAMPGGLGVTLKGLGVKNAGEVTYQSLNQHINERVQVNGYLIIPKIKDLCGGENWSTCKIWLDNDPYQEGFGLHEVFLEIGVRPNQISRDGKLLDYLGRQLELKTSATLNWYDVRISGIVSGCEGIHCTIVAEKIQAGP